jgi:hypothetical protein
MTTPIAELREKIARPFALSTQNCEVKTLADLASLVKIAIESGLRVTEIIQEPDGTARLLTEPQEIAPILDPLEEARKRRAAKGQGNAHSYEKAS